MGKVESGIFFFFASLFVLWESLRAGLGTAHKPGAGFLSFCTGVILTILSLILIREGWQIGKTRQNRSSLKVVLALVTIIIYSLVLDNLGFLVATFFLVGIFLYLGERRRWWALLGVSALVTCLAYFVFAILLQVPLPRSFFGI